jgi:exodeoxyribonuclease V alpha subunit
VIQTAYEADLTVRITKIFFNHKKSDTSIRFSAVPVDKVHHAVTSKVDLYTVKARETISPEPFEGEIWSIKGMASFEQTKSHNGKYFIKKHHVIVDEAKMILPKSQIGFKSFIADTPHFSGIGPGIAENIWKIFKSDIYNILKKKDLSKLLTVKALGKTSAISLVTGFEKFNYLKYSKFFTKHEIPVSIQKQIYKFKGINDGTLIERGGIKFDPNPAVMVKENPFSLSNFGMSFHMNDRIAKKHFNIKDDDKRRLTAAVIQCIKTRSKDGHTIVLHKQLMTPLRELLHYNEDLVIKALSQAYDKRSFIIYPYGAYQLTPTYIQENVIAKRFLKLHARGEVYNDEEDKACDNAFQKAPFELNPQQRKAVKTSISYAISTITGGTRTGKTAALNTVLNAYSELGYNIKAVALSDRATSRMHKSIKRPCSTIAAFLREDAIYDIADKKFLLVIDESEMIDLPTIFKIVIHIAPEVRILFVGDPNQLPPISAGNILVDLVKSKVIANTELNIVKGQARSSVIAEYCKQIKEGIVPAILATDFITHHETEFDYVADTCVELYKQSPSNSRVVAATNILVQKINVLCQKELNSGSKLLEFEEDGREKFFDRLYQNDPVLFTKNNYEAGVQNGSLGTLISVEKKGGYYGIVKIDDCEGKDNEFVPLTKELLLSLKAAYAIELRKVQDFIFPRVVVASAQGKNLDRDWLYTSLTRAKYEIHIVGPKDKIIRAIEKVSKERKRQTNLMNLLQKRL